MSFYSEKGEKKTPFHLFQGCLKDFPFDLGAMGMGTLHIASQLHYKEGA